MFFGDVIKNNVDTAGDVIEDNFDTFADQEYVCHHLVSTSSDILPDLSFCNFKPDQTRSVLVFAVLSLDLKTGSYI